MSSSAVHVDEIGLVYVAALLEHVPPAAVVLDFSGDRLLDE
ncbi:MAG TPA: hypothetical protein VMZ22_01980 [Acidimicrobiales bacterium]|nr:hypothetical protein [Acidimicrobiales bacterium]